MIHTSYLTQLCVAENIALVIADLGDAIYGCYVRHERLTRPVIALNPSLAHLPNTLRSVLAEQLGHHFTAVGENVFGAYFRNRKLLTGDDRRAALWAARTLLPKDTAEIARMKGYNLDEIAEMFGVTRELVQLRLTEGRPHTIVHVGGLVDRVNSIR